MRGEVQSEKQIFGVPRSSPEVSDKFVRRRRITWPFRPGSKCLQTTDSDSGDNLWPRNHDYDSPCFASFRLRETVTAILLSLEIPCKCRRKFRMNRELELIENLDVQKKYLMRCVPKSVFQFSKRDVQFSQSDIYIL